LAAEFEASQEWFRQGEPDFDDEFLRDFKREVLQDIHKLKREPRPGRSLAGFFNNRLALAGSVAALLLIAILAVFALRNNQESGSGSRPQQAAAPAEEGQDISQSADNSPAIKTPPAPDPVKPRKIYHARAKKAPAPRQPTIELITSRVEYLKEDAASEEFIKMEIQTSDPNIRIIWLHPKEPEQAQSNPSTDF
jgi:hypothetical protein